MYEWAGVLLTWGPVGGCPPHLRSRGRVSSSPEVQWAGVLLTPVRSLGWILAQGEWIRPGEVAGFLNGKTTIRKILIFFREEYDFLLRWLIHVLRRQDSNPYTLTKNCSKLFIQLFSFPILINCLFFQTLLLSRIIVRSVAGLLYRILCFHPDYFLVQ